MADMTCFWNAVERIAQGFSDGKLLTAALLAALVAPSLPAADFELGPPPGTLIAEGEEFSEDAVPEGVTMAEAGGYDGDGFSEPEAYPAPGDCQPGCGCKNCDPPYGMVNRLIDNKQATWTFRTDALLLWRDSPRSRPLFDTSPGGLTALNANQLNSTPAAGPRFSLFRTNGCGDALEATYFRAANFRAQSTLPTVSSGYAPAFVPSPATYDSASANLGAALQSFELNGRMTVASWVQLLGGFRWFEWQETLQLTTVPSDIADVSCMNSLYGYQIGFDSLLLSTNWLRLEGLMKGGAYYNNSRQVTTATVGGIPFATRADTPKGAAFLGEVGLTGVVPITRNIDFRVGYLGLWLQGIAQPTTQAQTTDPNAATLNTTGTAVVQGVTLGMEGRW
jgi:hypothetical protein